MTDVVLLNDTYAWYHWGCTGTSLAIREEIQALGLSLHSIPINMTYTFSHGPKRLEDFSDPAFFRVCRNANAGLFARMEDASVVVINGEGTIHGSSTTALSILYMAAAAKRWLNKNVQIINHSCFPQGNRELSDPLLCALYQTVYRQLDFIAFREHISAALMSQLGIHSVLSFDCLPLTIRRHYRRPAERADNTIVIAGSVAFDEGRIGELTAYIDAMHANGYQIQVLTGAKAYPAIDDANFVSLLQQRTGGRLSIVNAGSLTEWLDCIAGATLFVSGRFHHTIAAIMLHTPFLFMESNTPKNQALMETLGMPPPLQYRHSAFANELLSRTDRALSSAGVSEAALDSLCERARRNFSGLSGS